MKLVKITFGFWFIFWVVAGWRGGSVLTGMAFGGTPIVIIWGFWLMARQSRRDADFSPNRHRNLKDGTPERREFERLIYP